MKDVTGRNGLGFRALRTKGSPVLGEKGRKRGDDGVGGGVESVSAHSETVASEGLEASVSEGYTVCVCVVSFYD